MDKMVLDKMVWTKWYGQNGTILYFVYILIQLNSIYIFSNQKSQINNKHLGEAKGIKVEAGLMNKSCCQWERD